MLLAADRLIYTQESIAVVAESVGYESESAFSAAFKRTMGAGPREYCAQEDKTPQTSRVAVVCEDAHRTWDPEVRKPIGHVDQGPVSPIRFQDERWRKRRRLIDIRHGKSSVE